MGFLEPAQVARRDVQLIEAVRDVRVVVEVADALSGTITFPDDSDVQSFAGDVARFESVGDVVEIDDCDALNAGNFIQVEVIGDDTAAELFGQCHNFLVADLDIQAARSINWNLFQAGGQRLPMMKC